MVEIGISSINGLMGEILKKRIEVKHYCNISSSYSQERNMQEIESLCYSSDVVIDFSNFQILEVLLKSAIENKCKLVIGTTGLTDWHFELIKNASKKIPILYSPNMSLSVNILAAIIEYSSKFLKDEYDIEILESHHSKKKDFPSGTSLMLGKVLADAKNWNFLEKLVLNRITPRKKDEIGITSIRGGALHGEHEVMFLGVNDVISIKHTSLNREAFADGAIKAANWISNQDIGLYSMYDILFR